MTHSKFKNPIFLFLAATIWGTAFVAQSIGMDHMDPFTFNAIRSIIGAIALLPVIALISKFKGADAKSSYSRKDLTVGGILCGVVLFLASSLQQIGIQQGAEVGKAGFITSCYIIIVPLLGLVLKKHCSINVWISVVIAVAGLYLLCIKEGFTIQYRDILLFLCAVLFAVHILVIDKYSALADGVKLSCIQFLVCGVLSGILMFIFEKPQIENIISGWLPILYTGIISCGIAYTLQIVGQKGTDPSVASLILSLESVISVLSGWIILDEKLGIKELIGCALMFIAILLVECVPEIGRKREEKS